MTTKELREWCDRIDGFHCSCSSCKELQAASKIMRAAADACEKEPDCGELFALQQTIQETSVPK